MVCPIWKATEGFILGVGAKMFTITGPVIVCGVSASVGYGLIDRINNSNQVALIIRKQPVFSLLSLTNVAKMCIICEEQ